MTWERALFCNLSGVAAALGMYSFDIDLWGRVCLGLAVTWGLSALTLREKP